MLRPLVTGTRADPWAFPHSLKAGAVLVAFLAAIIGVAMVVVGPDSPPALLAAAVLLTFAVVLVLGIRMERAFVRSILDGV